MATLRQKSASKVGTQTLERSSKASCTIGNVTYLNLCSVGELLLQLRGGSVDVVANWCVAQHVVLQGLTSVVEDSALCGGANSLALTPLGRGESPDLAGQRLVFSLSHLDNQIQGLGQGTVERLAVVLEVVLGYSWVGNEGLDTLIITELASETRNNVLGQWVGLAELLVVLELA